MNFQVIYNIKLKNKPIVYGKKAIIKNCLDKNHCRIKLESILRDTFKEQFDLITIILVSQPENEFINFFNNLIK